ncbi:MAG: TIGR03905 family TSCPD domain-containing protein [Clostridiales bacterium]|nr:TIGR03905 family TSCPD domain-containing protein [Clostridiales bacterium]
MTYHYKTKGTCSSMINFDLEEGIVSNISFVGGCNGNLKAIGKILEGWKAEDVIARLKGNLCGRNTTSCADQLALALEKAMNE